MVNLSQWLLMKVAIKTLVKFSMTSEQVWLWLSATGEQIGTQCHGSILTLAARVTAKDLHCFQFPTLSIPLVVDQPHHQLEIMIMEIHARPLMMMTVQRFLVAQIADGHGHMMTQPNGPPRMPNADANQVMQSRRKQSKSSNDRRTNKIGIFTFYSISNLTLSNILH